MVWECPECAAQLAQFEGVVWEPPVCSYGHGTVEMEQRLACSWAGRSVSDD